MPQEAVALHVLAAGDFETLCRPRVNCGLKTGLFCDGLSEECMAVRWVPSENWAAGQATPLCRSCEDKDD